MSHGVVARGVSAKSSKIDAFRFVAAIWVMLAHVGAPPVMQIFPASALPVTGKLWVALNWLFAGPAAVIVFFAISGYCIHNAYYRYAELGAVNYYASRYLRIGLPLAVVLLLSSADGHAASQLHTILWSLYCELVYYTVYPLLRAAFRYLGEIIVAATLTAALLVAATHVLSHTPCTFVYESYGVPGTALLYSPVWMLGCLIADMRRPEARTALSLHYSRVTACIAKTLAWTGKTLAAHILVTRFLVIGAGSLCWMLQSGFHNQSLTLSFVGQDITLPIYQFLVAGWLAAEVQAPCRASTWTLPGKAGAWSYSLYLCHCPIYALLVAHDFTGTPAMRWLLSMAAILLGSYVFYLAVERPTHRFAHRLRDRARVRGASPVG